jgi:hypothetical protein
MVAIYHFSWVFLSIIAPILLLFHLFSSRLTLNLFRSMVEVASWKVVWSVLSAMLAALPFGSAYMADGNYLTVIVLNFVIALCMLGTPMVVHALVGSGLSGMTGALAPAVAGAMIAAPVKAASAFRMGRDVLGNTAGMAKQSWSGASSKVFGAITGTQRQNLVPPPRPNENTPQTPKPGPSNPPPKSKS